LSQQGTKAMGSSKERKAKEENEENVDGGGNSNGFEKRSHNSLRSGSYPNVKGILESRQENKTNKNVIL
jgi:hypothetical protein